MLPVFQCDICLTMLSPTYISLFSFLFLPSLFLLSLAVYFGHAACAVHPAFWPNVCIVFVLKILPVLTSSFSLLPLSVSLSLSLWTFTCFRAFRAINLIMWSYHSPLRENCACFLLFPCVLSSALPDYASSLAPSSWGYHKTCSGCGSTMLLAVNENCGKLSCPALAFLLCYLFNYTHTWAQYGIV